MEGENTMFTKIDIFSHIMTKKYTEKFADINPKIKHRVELLRRGWHGFRAAATRLYRGRNRQRKIQRVKVHDTPSPY